MSDEFDPPFFFREGVFVWGTPAAAAERQRRETITPTTPGDMLNQYDRERMGYGQRAAPERAPAAPPAQERER